MKGYAICFNEEKNQLLLATRRFTFEEVIVALENKQVLLDIDHPNKKWLKQRVYVIQINDYAYVVPYIVNDRKQEIFLKTIYASRYYTKLLIRKGA